MLKRSAIALCAFATSLIVVVTTTIAISSSHLERIQRWFPARRTEKDEELVDLELGECKSESGSEPHNKSPSRTSNYTCRIFDRFICHADSVRRSMDNPDYSLEHKYTSTMVNDDAEDGSMIDSEDTYLSAFGMTRNEYLEDLKIFRSSHDDSSVTRVRKQLDRQQLLSHNQDLGIEERVEIDFGKPLCLEEYRALFCKHRPVGDPRVKKEYDEHMILLGSGHALP